MKFDNQKIITKAQDLVVSVEKKKEKKISIMKFVTLTMFNYFKFRPIVYINEVQCMQVSADLRSSFNRCMRLEAWTIMVPFSLWLAALPLDHVLFNILVQYDYRCLMAVEE